VVPPVVIALLLFAAFKIDNTEPQITFPPHPMPADNALDYFHRAFLAAKLMKHKSPYDMSVPPAQGLTLANFHGCAVDAEPALKIMREGLKHPYMNPAARSIKSSIFPVFAELRELERVNSGAADYFAVTGDPGRSMQMRLDGLEMGAMMPKGGVLIAGLVGIACEAIAESKMEPLIPRLSSAQLASTAARLEQIAAKRVSYADIITEEGYTQTALIQETLRDPKTKANPFRAAVDMMGGDSEDDTTSWRERMSLRMKALKFTMQSKSAMLRENAAWNVELANEAKQMYTGPSKVPTPNNLIAEMIGGVFENAREKWVSRDAALVLIRVEVALFRFKKDHGSFPATLAELTPVYLAAIPADPFGGKPLHYALQDGAGFQLYSVGPDLQDNHGVPAKNIGAFQGDIVAGKLFNNRPILYTGP
jgi:hypothetical protein